MKPFRRDTCDDLGRHAAPGECFAHAKQPSRPRDGGEHGIGVERLYTAQIDHLDLHATGAEFPRDTQALRAPSRCR